MLADAVVVEELCQARSGGVAKPLVDRQRLPQPRDSLPYVVVLEVGPAQALQGACLFERGADVVRYGQGLRMVEAGVLGVGGAQGELTEAVERLGLANPVPELAEQRQCVLQAGGCSLVIPGLL